MEYVSSSIEDTYLVNDATTGTIKFTTKIDGGFADGELTQPINYNVDSSSTILVKSVLNTNTSENNQNSEVIKSQESEENESPIEYPKTGPETYLLLIGFLIMIVTISITSFKGIKKYKDI